MYATIQKWGNSQGLRLPKALLEDMGLSENDRVEITQSSDGIVIRKATQRPHRSLDDRLTQFYGKPVDSITKIADDAEEDWDVPVGNEVW